MQQDIPEEIWNVILNAVAELDQHDSHAAGREAYAQEMATPARAFLARIQEHGALRSPPTLLLALSQVSHTFRRLALPYLCQDVVVQTASSYSESEADSPVEKLKSMPHPELVKQLLIQERARMVPIPREEHPSIFQTRWGLYASIAAHFPHIRALRFEGLYINLHECPTEFLSTLSRYDQVTVPSISLQRLADSPTALDCDLSRITALHTTLYNASDVRRLNRLHIRTKHITLMSTHPDPAYQASWSARTYLGLKHLCISGNFYHVSDKTMLLDFFSRHPTLTSLQVSPNGRDQNLNSFYLTEGLSDASNPSFDLGNAYFKRVDVKGSVSEPPKFECSSISVYSRCSALDDFAALIGRLGKVYPTIANLEIEAMFWKPVFHEIPVEIITSSFASLTRLKDLLVDKILLPQHLPVPPATFPQMDDTLHRDIYYSTLRLMHIFARGIPSLKTIDILWISLTNGSPFEVCGEVERDCSKGVERVIIQMGPAPLCWPIEEHV